MSAPSTIYVDPSIAGNSGSGTSGDPYGDLRWALSHFTFDSTNGTNVLLKSGTTEYDADIPIVCTPTQVARLKFGIYGGTSKAVINGSGGASPIFDHWGGANHTKSYVSFKDIHFTNVNSSNVLVEAYNYMTFDDCEFSESAGGVGWISGTVGGSCHCGNFHDMTGSGLSQCNHAIGNYFKNGTSKKFTYAINLIDGHEASFNIMSLDSTSWGIYANGGCTAMHNSAYSTGNGKGISAYGAASPPLITFLNNVVEGFDYCFAGYVTDVLRMRGNAGYGGTTATYYIPDVLHIGTLSSDDNETLASAPFTKSGSDIFSNRFTYFGLNNVGNVRTGAYLGNGVRSKGAVQYAGSSGSYNPFQPPFVFGAA